MNAYPGFFLTFEGIEGTGKTSHSRHLFHYLQENRFSSILTCEPGGTAIGERIRNLLLHPETGAIDPLTEVLLFEASRREHVVRVIRPALEWGQVVVCVRYIDSTIAYQGYGRGIPIETLESLNVLATGGLLPDLTILLDVDPEEGLIRSFHHTASEELRFEEEFIRKKDILLSIRDGFFFLAQNNSHRFEIISTSGPKEEVFERIRVSVIQAIAKKRRGETR
ncbi:MAG: dTMP kinase [Candidatus Atribacteria bacterium]|nr:dTMP kinase [Candidatus Atribacteria bacterium]